SSLVGRGFGAVGIGEQERAWLQDQPASRLRLRLDVAERILQAPERLGRATARRDRPELAPEREPVDLVALDPLIWVRRARVRVADRVHGRTVAIAASPAQPGNGREHEREAGSS